MMNADNVFLEDPQLVDGDIYEVEVMAGSILGDVTSQAIAFSEKHGAAIRFNFNGVQITVKEDSDSKLVHRDWNRAQQGCIDKVVGPYPPPKLSAETKKHDAHVRRENARKRAKRRAERAAPKARGQMILEIKLQDEAG